MTKTAGVPRAAAGKGMVYQRHRFFSLRLPTDECFSFGSPPPHPCASLPLALFEEHRGHRKYCAPKISFRARQSCNFADPYCKDDFSCGRQQMQCQKTKIHRISPIFILNFAPKNAPKFSRFSRIFRAFFLRRPCHFSMPNCQANP